MKLTARVGGVVFLGGLCLGVLGVAMAEEASPVAVLAGPAVASSTIEVDPAARSSHHDALVRAIGEKHLLHFTYAGHARVVEPYAYGVSATGEAVLHGYQVAGGSTSKPPPGWRTFAVSGISEVVETSRRFSKLRADYSSERPKLDPQWAEVEGAAKPDEAAADAAE
ncbi:MAG: hypothetical protein H7067_09450 [Burkholderiales bacterium]|nr:hypothetical protein [Opitutaceae bacterium]